MMQRTHRKGMPFFSHCLWPIFAIFFNPRQMFLIWGRISLPGRSYIAYPEKDTVPSVVDQMPHPILSPKKYTEKAP